MADMSTYLSAVTADYTATELILPIQNIIVEEGKKQQVFHEYDDMDIVVVTFSESYFTIKVQCEFLEETEKDLLLAFWHNYAAGGKNSFYWPNPADGNTYTVKFLQPVTIVKNPYKFEYIVNNISLIVEGTKP